MKILFKKFDIKRRVKHDNYKNLLDVPVFYLSDFEENIIDVAGMLTDEQGKFLFTIAFAQSIKGDIIEIGSWQGKSTIYLAEGAKQSKNGAVYAIDHFKGNPGSASGYKINKDDLSDLKDSFLANIKKAGVSDTVKLLDINSREAAGILKNQKIEARLLFIDGNHSYEGIKNDFDNYFDLVSDGGIIILDDYRKDSDGVVKLVNELMKKERIKSFYSYRNTFVIKK